MMSQVYDVTEQAERKNKVLTQDNHEFATLTLETSGKDCDGPHFFKDCIYVTESELHYALADHFGINGWTLSEDLGEFWASQRIKTEEGYVHLDAHWYFPKEEV